jgi:hypothetical protein
MRLCAFPYALPRNGSETRRSGDLLSFRILKKTLATESPGELA